MGLFPFRSTNIFHSNSAENVHLLTNGRGQTTCKKRFLIHTHYIKYKPLLYTANVRLFACKWILQNFGRRQYHDSQEKASLPACIFPRQCGLDSRKTVFSHTFLEYIVTLFRDVRISHLCTLDDMCVH